MDETCIKVKGRRTYLYRAVDRDFQTLDFLLSERRDLAAARCFFKRLISSNGVPNKVVIDRSGANLAGLQAVNVILKFSGSGRCCTAWFRSAKSVLYRIRSAPCAVRRSANAAVPPKLALDTFSA